MLAERRALIGHNHRPQPHRKAAHRPTGLTHDSIVVGETAAFAVAARQELDRVDEDLQCFDGDERRRECR